MKLKFIKNYFGQYAELLLDNDEPCQFLNLKESTTYRKRVALELLLHGGPPNNLKDCELCYSCGKKVVDKKNKLTNEKKDFWVICCLVIIFL